jgi:hypothetical protein
MTLRKTRKWRWCLVKVSTHPHLFTRWLIRRRRFIPTVWLTSRLRKLRGTYRCRFTHRWLQFFDVFLFVFIFCSRMPSAYMTSSIDYPSLDHSVNSVGPTQTGNRSDPVSICSTQRSLAEALHERGVGHSITGWSGLSTPNNSPGCPSPEESSSRFFHETWGLLTEGAKMIRRTLTGEETPMPPTPPQVPRIARKELEVIDDDILLRLD